MEIRNTTGTLLFLTLGVTVETRDDRHAEEKGANVTLTTERAKQLAQDRGGRLLLDHLTSLAPDPKLVGPVRYTPEMLRRLAGSDWVRQVFIRHAFRCFLGRNETPGDAASLQEAEKAYLGSGGSFKALLVSLLSLESFLYRNVPAQEKK